jgi:hypothetical protein
MEEFWKIRQVDKILLKHLLNFPGIFYYEFLNKQNVLYGKFQRQQNSKHPRKREEIKSNFNIKRIN